MHLTSEYSSDRYNQEMETLKLYNSSSYVCIYVCLRLSIINFLWKQMYLYLLLLVKIKHYIISSIEDCFH